MNERQMIYDELCRVLTDYEGNGSEDGASADDLYSMLVKIQNRWEDTITVCDCHAKEPVDNTEEDEKRVVAKNCAVCGGKMVWENPLIPGHFQESSCELENWPICHDCMIEHCCSEECRGCKFGDATDPTACEFYEMKRHYMSQD